jgi:hypothetical protein
MGRFAALQSGSHPRLKRMFPLLLCTVCVQLLLKSCRGGGDYASYQIGDQSFVQTLVGAIALPLIALIGYIIYRALANNPNARCHDCRCGEDSAGDDQGAESPKIAFIKNPRWDGARLGYVYRLGPLGLGYYKDHRRVFTEML